MRILMKTAFILLFGLLLSNSSIFAANPERPKQILIFNSHDSGMPWQRIVNQAIHKAFEADTSIRTQLHTEYTGLSQNFDDAYVRELIDLYGHKYAGWKMDLIIAVDVAATDFMIEYEEELFPGVPVVFISETKDMENMVLLPNMTGLLTEIDVKGTIDVALELNPDTQHIAVISGASKMDRLFEAAAREVFPDYENRLEFIDLTGLPMSELLTRVAQLPEHTIGLYVLTLMDGAGKAFIPKKILARISQASNAPLYGLWDSLLGGGIVGGDLSSAEAEGSRAAEMGLRILGGEKPGDIPIIQGVHAYMFDWRQLERWGIRENDLPTGSIVRYKAFSFWDLYKGRIMGFTALLIFEGVLILILLIQLRRRRRAEKALKKAHDELELRVDERTAELSETNEQLQKEITDRKQAEEELRESEEKYRNILENIEDGYFEVDIAGNLTFFNDSLVKILGYSKDELIGMNSREYTDEENAKKLYKTFNTVSTTGKPDKGFDWEIIRKDGSKRYVEASVSLRKDSEDQPIGFRGVVRDITEKKKIQEELQKAKKLESLGILAGGIAHDFNNLMSAVIGYISLARMETKPGGKAFENLVKAEKASIETKDLVARLITFSEGGDPVKETVSIGDLIKDSVDSSLKDSDMDAGFSIPDDIALTAVDEDQMKQVIHNIITNAREAMAGQGTINVSCENVDVGENDPLTLKEGKYVKISIEDQGPGIPDKDLKKIFDPYFSTKDMGTQKGMGLGLAVAHSIVQKHNGLITVESEVGSGSIFHIYLPAIALAQARRAGLPASSVEQKAPSTKAEGVQAQSSINNHQSNKVLVMDDEEMMRDVSNGLLTHMGYKVTVAVEGAEAIEIYKKAMGSDESFDMVILDLTNKVGMGGVETIKRLLEIDPDVKAIVATGYSNDPIISNFREHGFCGSLPKPFSMDELKTALREVIAGE
ncbi:MAG: PAS domain S-box protein [Thermodesulfobacteriota bacterium]|nr:PAS domain S-box protein [Thermodesulfobacteriota bacterium]